MAVEKPTWKYKLEGDKQTASEMNQLAKAVITNATELSNTKYDVAGLINNATGLDNRITDIEESGPINQADDDDLENTIINGVPVIREKTTKTYNPDTYSGMGRVILRKNMVGGVNVLTQSMVNQANTVYEIRYDFDLYGATITMPENSIIKFAGGSFKNGTINGNKSTFNHECGYNILNNCIIKNFTIPYIDIRWFGAISGLTPEFLNGEYTGKYEGTDCHDAFSLAIQISNYYLDIPILIIGNYYIGSTIEYNGDLRLVGDYNGSFSQDYVFGDANHLTSSQRPNLYVSGVTAFKSVSGNFNVYDGYISIKNLFVYGSEYRGVGHSTVFLDYSLSGGPSRPGCIKDCAFINLYKAFYLHTNGVLSSVYNNLEISSVRGAYLGYFLFTEDLSVDKSLNVISNLSVRDCNIENCGLSAFYLHNVRESIYFNNNCLENNNNTFDIGLQYGKLSILNTYYEYNEGDYLIKIDVMGVNNYNNAFIEIDGVNYNSNTGASNIEILRSSTTVSIERVDIKNLACAYNPISVHFSVNIIEFFNNYQIDKSVSIILSGEQYLIKNGFSYSDNSMIGEDYYSPIYNISPYFVKNNTCIFKSNEASFINVYKGDGINGASVGVVLYAIIACKFNNTSAAIQITGPEGTNAALGYAYTPTLNEWRTYIIRLPIIYEMESLLKVQVKGDIEYTNIFFVKNISNKDVRDLGVDPLFHTATFSIMDKMQTYNGFVFYNIEDGVTYTKTNNGWSKSEKVGILRSGNYASRPLSTSAIPPTNVGFQYYNTDTHKYMTWESGDKYYYADGTKALA